MTSAWADDFGMTSAWADDFRASMSAWAKAAREAHERIDPADPFTPLKEGAAQLHELYESFREAGFSDWQALVIIGVMLKPAPPDQAA